MDGASGAEDGREWGGRGTRGGRVPCSAALFLEGQGRRVEGGAVRVRVGAPVIDDGTPPRGVAVAGLHTEWA
jgi:hypothetical protein